MPEDTPPPRMAEEVAKTVLALKPEFEQIRGEIRAKTEKLGNQIGAINASITAQKVSLEKQMEDVKLSVEGVRGEVDALRKGVDG